MREQVQFICPACGQQVEAVAIDSRIKGYCAVAKKSVDVPIKKTRISETKTKTSTGPTTVREGRDSRGRFGKGNVPQNKKRKSQQG